MVPRGKTTIPNPVMLEHRPNNKDPTIKNTDKALLTIDCCFTEFVVDRAFPANKVVAGDGGHSLETTFTAPTRP